MSRYMVQLCRYYAGVRPVTLELRRYHDPHDHPSVWRCDTRTYLT